jgi:hypothetical protein
MTEILNSNGEVASKEEMKEISELYSIPIIKVSEILCMNNHQLISSFSGTVIHGRCDNYIDNHRTSDYWFYLKFF